MISTQLMDKLGRGGTVLCLGAHSDDIEIGCGGLISKITRLSGDITFNWVVFSASGRREAEARASAAEMLQNTSGSQVLIKNFRNGFFPYVGADIKDFFEELKKLPDPDLILTHFRGDLHQDHRVISELSWNTFRNHLIAEYEIPKYDGDTGSPNAFVALEEQDLARKVAILDTHFNSQKEKQWFSTDTFSGLCRLRGVQCNSPTGLAEAFYCRKLLLG